MSRSIQLAVLLFATACEHAATDAQEPPNVVAPESPPPSTVKAQATQREAPPPKAPEVVAKPAAKPAARPEPEPVYVERQLMTRAGPKWTRVKEQPRVTREPVIANEPSHATRNVHGAPVGDAASPHDVLDATHGARDATPHQPAGSTIMSPDVAMDRRSAELAAGATGSNP